jgi:hypothetical protein
MRGRTPRGTRHYIVAAIRKEESRALTRVWLAFASRSRVPHVA